MPSTQLLSPPRCGSTRRCSSLSSLPSDDPKGQPQRRSGSRPPSQHRSTCSWASTITVPRPFRMMLREAQKKAQWLASPASFEQERKQAQRQGQEEAECHRQFRAQPVPAHVYLPLYQEITERNEARRQAGIQKRKELLLSSLKPFSFLVKEEQRKEAAKQRELAATAKAKVPKQKATRRIPKSILEPALGDKFQGKDLLPTCLLPGGYQEVLWGLRLGGQPGWEKKSLFGRTSLQTTLRAGHRVGLALSVLWGSPGRSRMREVARHSPGWSCDQSLSEDTNAFAAAQVQEQREPVRHPTTSLGQCHHQLPLTEVPTPPSSWCDAHFKK